MRVVHLLSQVELTGAEVYAVDLTDELIKRGHSCYIVSDKIHKRTKASFIPLPIHNASFARRLRSIIFLRRFIKTNGIHVIHAHSRAAVRIGFWATRFSHCALVSTLHGKQHYSYSKKLFNIYGENILSVCENIKTHFVQQFGFHSAQVQIARNFLNTDYIDSLIPAAPSPASPSITVSFLGRTSGPKGLNWANIINNYVEVWMTKFPNVIFQFGGGEVSYLSDATQQKIKRLTLAYPTQFKFLGKLDQLFQTIASSDVVFGSGRIAIESMYLKKPVLAIGEEVYLGLVTLENFNHCAESNFGDIDYQTKYAVNFEALKTELEKLLSQPELLPALPALALKEKVAAYFNRTHEVNQITEFYEWAQVKRRINKNIPILMYHQIVEPEFTSPHKIYVTEQRFDEHMNYLKSAGFQSLTFKDLLDFKSNPDRPFPKRPVIISFDDGYENNYTKALPILKKHGLNAVFYLLANPHSYNYWDADSKAPQLKLMTSQQRKNLALDMEIGSHGFDHKKLSTLSDAQAVHEFESSKAALEQEFGSPILSYAYTYGDRSERDIQLAKRAGYAFAVNTTRGVLHFADNPHNLFRVSIFPTDTVSDLKRKTKSWYRRYYYFKRKD